MAESVDALVSNTSSFGSAGSTPAPGTFLHACCLFYFSRMNVTYVKSLTGHTSPIYHLQVIDQSTLLSCDGNGWLILWNTTSGTGELIAKCDKSVFSFLKQDHTLIIGDQSGKLYWIDLTNKTLLGQQKICSKGIFSIQYSSQQNQIYIVDEDGQLTVFDCHRNMISKTKLSKECLRSISISEKRNSLYIASRLGVIYEYSLTEQAIVNSYPFHQQSIFTTALIGDLLFFGGRDAKLVCFNTQTERVINTSNAHLNTINKISISEKNDLLFTASRDKSFKIWNSTDLQLRKVINSKKFPAQIQRSINCITNHQEFIFTAGDDKKIVIWQMN